MIKYPNCTEIQAPVELKGNTGGRKFTDLERIEDVAGKSKTPKFLLLCGFRHVNSIRAAGHQEGDTSREIQKAEGLLYGRSVNVI